MIINYHKAKKLLSARLALVIISLLMVNIVSYHFFIRLDLTADKRYSIHPATKKLLATLEDSLAVEIYLADDLPVDLRQLQRATKELLATFQAYTKYPIHYEVVNMHQMAVADRKKRLKNLADKGIGVTNLYVQEQGQRKEKMIYPGLLLKYRGQEAGVMLLKSQAMTSMQQMVSQSIENLEYEMTQAIAKLVNKNRIKLGLIQGHGGPKAYQLQGFKQALQEHYQLDQVNLDKIADLVAYQALFMVKPQQAFSESEKYVLDQYIMQGGKVLFFLDCMKIDMESLHQGRAFALPLELNLDDLLFKYGLRIKQDLVQDLYAGVCPVIVGKLGNQPQLQFLPWPFFPILNNFARHITTKNLNPLYSQFINSLDTVKADGVLKTPLVFTSPYSRSLGAPVHVDLESLRKAPDKKFYNQGPMPVVYLLEGVFSSLYKNRLPPPGFSEELMLVASKPTKIFVAASSLVLNAMDPSQNEPLPWGYDPFLRQKFANEDFISNILSYMLAEDGLINTKRKVVQLRYLDNIKVTQNKLRVQLLNSCMPILLLLVVGWGWRQLYKRKYSHF
jgi:ABC-2 type transport system permease protein